MVSLLLACGTWRAPPTVDAPAAEAAVDTAVDVVVDTGESDPGETDTDTGPTVDLDGDGHLAIEDGGDDCDDADRWTYPGAQEWCDDTDQDCDGEALAPGVCALTQPFTSRAAEISPTTFDWLLPVRDVTGDGHDDMLVWSGGGATALAAGDGTRDAFTTWTWVQEWSSAGLCDHPDGRFDVGDIDGDGYNDVAIQEEICHPGFEIYWGPITAGQASAEPTVWDDPDHETTTWASGMRVADLDGDGAPDLTRIPVLDGRRTLVTYFGGAREQRMSTIEKDDLNFGMVDFAEPLGDVDGDGLEDIAWATDAVSAWISGADVPGSGAALLSDVGYGTFADAGTSVPTSIAAPSDFLAVGDQSGDGLEDVVIVHPSSDSLPEQSFVYYDSFRASDTEPAGVVAFDVAFGCTLPALLRNDGASTALFCYSTYYYSVIPLIWRTGTWNLSETEHLVIDHDSGDPEEPVIAAYGWGQGDLEADGWSDVVVTSRVGTWLFDPFDDIPWGEEQYW